MKVYIYALPDGRRDILVTASPGSQQAPVLLPDVPRDKVKEVVLPVVMAMRRPRPSSPVG